MMSTHDVSSRRGNRGKGELVDALSKISFLVGGLSTAIKYLHLHAVKSFYRVLEALNNVLCA